MIIYRSKVNSILFEFAFSKASKGTVILCDGLPSVPKQKDLMFYFVKNGYSVVYPRYRGTWESGGEFLKSSPAKDILTVIKKIKDGEIKELYADKTIKLNSEKIFLLGSSFGGSVALSLARHKSVTKIVALSPVIDFAKHNDKGTEQDLAQLAKFIIKAFPNGYRFNKKNWKKLLEGEVFNPKQKLNKIEAAKIIVIYGLEDTVVDYKKISEYSKNNDLKSIAYKTEGHLSLSKLSNKIKTQIVKYLSDK